MSFLSSILRHQPLPESLHSTLTTPTATPTNCYPLRSQLLLFLLPTSEVRGGGGGGRETHLEGAGNGHPAEMIKLANRYIPPKQIVNPLDSNSFFLQASCSRHGTHTGGTHPKVLRIHTPAVSEADVPPREVCWQLFGCQSVSAKSAELSGAMFALLCVHYISCCIITDFTIRQHSHVPQDSSI